MQGFIFSACLQWMWYDVILCWMRKTLFGQLAEWHLMMRPQHYALKDRHMQMKVLSQQFNCLSYILMIIQTLLRKWMKQASSALLGKEEQWWHLFHLLKQHYKMKELSAGHVWGQMFISAPNLPSLTYWSHQIVQTLITYCTNCTSNLHAHVHVQITFLN